MNATMYRLATSAARTGGSSLRPATRMSTLQQLQARSFSSAHRLSQNRPHLPKVKPDDTMMYVAFGAVGVSVITGMWYTLITTGTRMSGHFRARDIKVQEVLNMASKLEELPRL